MQELSAVDIAAKRRHLHLLRKVRGGPALTAAELKELDKYENMAKKKHTPAVSLEIKKTGAGVIRLGEAGLKLLALEGKSIAEAEMLLETQLSVISCQKKKAAKSASKNLKKGKRKRAAAGPSSPGASTRHASLNELFEKRKDLRLAWERGTFLKNIAEFGGKNYTIAEAESQLEMETGQLEQIFLKDFEASNTWNQARLKTLLAIKGKWLEMVGLATPSALKQLEKLMRREIAHKAVDFSRLTTAQMMELTGKTRQTIQYEWPVKQGLSRNSDGTYNLAVFLKWFEEFTLKTKTVRPAVETNSLADEKTIKVRLENEETVGRLLDRTKVIAGLVGRQQTIVRLFTKTIAEQKEPATKQILERVFDEIRRELATNIFDMKLNEKQAAILKKLLDNLMGEDNAGS